MHNNALFSNEIHFKCINSTLLCIFINLILHFLIKRCNMIAILLKDNINLEYTIESTLRELSIVMNNHGMDSHLGGYRSERIYLSL